MNEDNAVIPYDAGDSGHVRKAKRASRVSAESEALTVRSMLASAEQRAFWWELLSSCGIFRAEMVGAESLLFLTGQRNIGLMLLAKVPTDLYKIMQDEAQERGKASNAP